MTSFFFGLFIESNWICPIFVVRCVQIAQPVKHFCFSATIRSFEWPIKFHRWPVWIQWRMIYHFCGWRESGFGFICISVFVRGFFFDFRLDKMSVLIVAIKCIKFCPKRKKTKKINKPSFKQIQIYILKVIYICAQGT